LSTVYKLQFLIVGNIEQINWKKITITVLRVAIGWHFFYEGISKLFAENWTVQGFLTNATGPFSEFYHWLSVSSGLMRVVDVLNVYGLILIGVTLFIGMAFRLAAISGVTLLTLILHIHLLAGL